MPAPPSLRLNGTYAVATPGVRFWAGARPNQFVFGCVWTSWMLLAPDIASDLLAAMSIAPWNADVVKRLQPIMILSLLTPIFGWSHTIGW
jgi:hypothetical protein